MKSSPLPPVLHTRSVLTFCPPGKAAATISRGLTPTTGGISAEAASETTWGELGSLLRIVRVLPLVPAAAGVKVTRTSRLWRAGRLNADGLAVYSEALAPIEVTVRTSVPMFRMVSDRVALWPTKTLPKSIEMGSTSR